VIRWHRQGFKRFWRWKSRRNSPGRPMIDAKLRALIRRLSSENPTWGAPRIHGELSKLGYAVNESTVAKYMVRHPKPPSQTWRSFLKNHAKDIAACDFFTVPTATFRLLFVFFIISHDRRKILHVNVTDSPTAEWTGQQVVNAFPYDTAHKYLIHDRDSIFGKTFKKRVKSMGIEEVITAPESPLQNPYAERFVGSARRECVDHCIVLNTHHLQRILNEYVAYYNSDRTHLGLKKDSPARREVETPELGEVKSRPVLGGLHHRYYRDAA
jgi:putative transposase